MERYIVTYLDEPGDNARMQFQCWAEDADDASVQCENAYPGCVVVHAYQTEEWVEA